MRTPQDTARLSLACLDLTSLNDADRDDDIVRLAARAARAPGRVAALCVWPRLVPTALAHAPAGVAVAAVANFPDGSDDLARALRDTEAIVAAGAQEVDVVLPWRALAEGEVARASAVVRAVRRACDGRMLKVILESGELKTDALVRAAAQLAIAEGADFLKTSTGKTPTGATPEAARTMLEAIAADTTARTRIGFKASGGVRRVADAAVYLDLVEDMLGVQALNPQRVRLGASALLDDIEAVLGGRDGASGTGY